MDQPPPPPLPLPQSPTLSSDDKIWAVLCHLSLIIGVGFLLPLIVYLIKKQDSPVAAEHPREALNFHISVYLYGFVALLLCFVLIGIPLLVLIALGSLIFAIIAAIDASHGTFYRYPLTIRLV